MYPNPAIAAEGRGRGRHGDGDGVRGLAAATRARKRKIRGCLQAGSLTVVQRPRYWYESVSFVMQKFQVLMVAPLTTK